MAEITQEQLHELFHYDENTGHLIRKVKIPRARNANVGDIAGYATQEGYSGIKVAGKKYQAHRLIWFYVYGEWPEEIDHINGNKSDNRLSNLRNCGRLVNARNLHSVRGKSKYMGVHPVKNRNKWRACIRAGGNPIWLGEYDTEEEARDAYLVAKAKYHGTSRSAA